jgi:hypothetical protein
MYLESGIALPETDLNILKEGYTASSENIKNIFSEEQKSLTFSFED